MEPHELARLVAINGYAAWSATLVGDPAPSVRALYDRMRDPQPGDLVLETSTGYREPWDPGALGYLDRVVMEPAMSPEQWAEGADEGEPLPYEQIWYVRPFVPTEDGKWEVRWHNASFIALPDRMRWGQFVSAP
jgi:hypothetical protein